MVVRIAWVVLGLTLLEFAVSGLAWAEPRKGDQGAPADPKTTQAATIDGTPQSDTPPEGELTSQTIESSSHDQDCLSPGLHARNQRGHSIF